MSDLEPWWRHVPPLGLVWGAQLCGLYRRRLICVGGAYTLYLTLTERGRQSLAAHEAASASGQRMDNPVTR